MRIMWKNSGDCPCSSILVFLPALVRISHTEKICPNPAVTLKSWHLPPGASMMQYGMCGFQKYPDAWAHQDVQIYT